MAAAVAAMHNVADEMYLVANGNVHSLRDNDVVGTHYNHNSVVPVEDFVVSPTVVFLVAGNCIVGNSPWDLH